MGLLQPKARARWRGGATELPLQQVQGQWHSLLATLVALLSLGLPGGGVHCQEPRRQLAGGHVGGLPPYATFPRQCPLADPAPTRTASFLWSQAVTPGWKLRCRTTTSASWLIPMWHYREPPRPDGWAGGQELQPDQMQTTELQLLTDTTDKQFLLLLLQRRTEEEA